MTPDDRPYRGRFAPSPTGDLHFGSLVAAVASFLEARRNHGKWLIRIEDIDPPREVAGSAERILRDLERLGLTSDEPVLYQSSRMAIYEETTEALINNGSAFWCGCSRSDLPPSGIYPGTCRNGLPAGRTPRAVRLRVDDEPVVFEDRLQGTVSEHLAETVGDFVIRRADGLPAYQLAVTLDDAYQEITHIVRGADLLESTPRQVFLQRQLGLPSPEYAHVPVAVESDGKKLSKRDNSDPIQKLEPHQVVVAALRFLGLDPPGLSSLDDTWTWAIQNWNMENLRGLEKRAALEFV